MQSTTGQSIRRHDLDWLRIAAILAVFLFHSVHFFDPGDWSVKNYTTYNWVSWLMDFMGVWLMPLIFLVSGASVFCAFSKKKVINFVFDKVMRLLVPLLVGVFSFSIMQVYLERISHHQFQGTFLQFIPHYFKGIYVPGGTGNFAFHGMHLWYLLFLFTFTILFMPLFWWFKGDKGSRALKRLGDILAIPGTQLLFLVPTVLIQNLSISSFFQNAGWGMVQYPWFFLAGYLIISHPKLQSQIIRMRWIWLGLALASIVSSLLLHKGPANHRDILVWLELLTILGFAMKRLNFSNEFLAYTNEVVMPFYILHQNILLLIGFFVVDWALPDIVKYLIITISTLLIIMVLYKYFVRKYNIIRILFGMKPVTKEVMKKNESYDNITT